MGGWVAGICQPWGQYSIWGLAGHSGSPWIPQAPTFHLSEAAVNGYFLAAFQPNMLKPTETTNFEVPFMWETILVQFH